MRRGLEVNQPRAAIVRHQNVRWTEVTEAISDPVKAAKDLLELLQDPRAGCIVRREVGGRPVCLYERGPPRRPAVQTHASDELGDQELVLPLTEVVERLGADTWRERM